MQVFGASDMEDFFSRTAQRSRLSEQADQRQTASRIYIFSREVGDPGTRTRRSPPTKQAVTLGCLPPAASAYTLRHCVLTDLVVARLPILTVAQISDTSVQMIERHYGHLVGDDAAKALDTLAI